MPKFLIEREIPGASQLTPEQLVGVAQRSRAVLRELGPEIQWVQSFVNGDKITCVYLAPDAELIREHARRGKFPCNRVEMISAIIDPTTAEGAMWAAAPAAAVA